MRVLLTKNIYNGENYIQTKELNWCLWRELAYMAQLCVNCKTWFYIDHNDKVPFVVYWCAGVCWRKKWSPLTSLLLYLKRFITEKISVQPLPNLRELPANCWILSLLQLLQIPYIYIPILSPHFDDATNWHLKNDPLTFRLWNLKEFRANIWQMTS